MTRLPRTRGDSGRGQGRGEDGLEWLAADDDDGLAALSTMVGALLLARATRGTDVSDRILAAARATLAQ